MARSHPRRCSERGFTLIEVLVALAVLAIAMSAIMRAITQAVDTTAALRDRTMALMVAEDRLALHTLNHDWPAVASSNGWEREGGRDWFWHEQVEATPFDQFRRIEINVGAQQDGQTLAHLIGFLREPS